MASKSGTTKNEKIVCDKFTLVTRLTGSTLFLRVDTDLPDFTGIMVSVDRLYWEKGNSEAYSVDYFDEKSTVGKWKTEQKINIDNVSWRQKLLDRQNSASRAGIGFTVGSISDNISIGITVPVNQDNPLFGEKNANLTGSEIVTKYGMNNVRGEKDISMPLNAKKEALEKLPSVDPNGLDVNQSYIVNRETPLMPARLASDPASKGEVKYIPIKGGFKVLEIYKGNNETWYRATAFKQNRNEIGKGWINSIALLGQKLEPIK